ncbi:hypothetical protein Y032_0050g2059 [Ancylostoma ceylanicum]|nr:hypothetical protein Y032_0050g2059 [Ancylostoma ceylanicum]
MSRRRSLPVSYEVYTTLCDFWRRGEVCRFGGNCWYAHGPAHMRANATDENRALSSDSTNPQSTELPEHEEALDPSMNQFTPEQQQWMYLSQRAQTFLPLAHNILAARFNELCQKAGALTEVSMPGRTCEEIEREQTARACAAAGQRANSLLQLSTAGSYSSGPTTPTESGGWFSFFDDTLKEKAASHLRNIVDNVISDTTEFYLIPFEKEVCTLYRHGQCPFGSSCFFEHPGEEDEGVFSDD